MKTIYVVTSGSYSDYGIEGVFTERELAQSFIDAFVNPYEGMDIEEWPLDPHRNDLMKKRKVFLVSIDKEGNADALPQSRSPYLLNKEEYGFPPGISFRDNKKIMNCVCFANDDKHAIKIANEKRIQFLALNKWPQ